MRMLIEETTNEKFPFQIIKDYFPKKEEFLSLGLKVLLKE
jgi:hypothetical protein